MTLAKKIGVILVCLFAFVGLATVIAFIAIQLHLTKVPGLVDSQNRYLNAPQKTAWREGEEWQTLKKAIIADKSAIQKASDATEVPARLIVANIVVEQLRLYTSQREIFKKIFQPLQILGVQSQFSWGIMGLKQETAVQIENHLTDRTSSYYLGPKYEHLLDFKTADKDTERFDRIIDEHNHYYSYLYSALFLKQIITQWQKAGFDISDRPEILSTLFNIGFAHSTPNADPKVGGAEIPIGTEKYSFGELAYAFYTSDELTDIFPN